MLEFVLRAATMYFMALIMIRVLGKRALGELGPFDFVVMTGVGHTVVTVALDEGLPIYAGVIILATLVVLEFLMGYLSLKSGFFSNMIVGKPVTLIDNGIILKENLKKEKFNVDDLLQELRKQGVRNIREVERGTLESCGGFSVILREEEEAVTRRDLGLIHSDPNEFSTIKLNRRQDIFDTNDAAVLEDDPPPSIFSLLESLDLQMQAINERLNMIESALK